jgi:hypothetical protein
MGLHPIEVLAAVNIALFIVLRRDMVAAAAYSDSARREPCSEDVVVSGHLSNVEM